jgi:hypothetical protein
MNVLALDATAARPAPRSPDKAALKYLEASGARAISITCGSGHVVINVGYKPNAVAAYWLPADKARSVAARARSIAGGTDGVEAVVAAVKEAAVQCRVTLTPHDIAISRAHAMAERLDAFMDALKGNGTLREFTRAYKRRRIAAAERGEGFMSYGAALARLRRAMIPILQNGGKAVIGASIFAEIFNT